MTYNTNTATYGSNDSVYGVYASARTSYTGEGKCPGGCAVCTRRCMG